MSENLEDLLEGVDEESEGDYDLGDEEEEALLDDNFGNETENHQSSSTSKNTGGHELEYETEPDFVLELDDGTELQDEEDGEILINNSSLNIEEEQERSRKTEKFTSERVIPTSIVSPHSKSTVQNATGKSFTAHKQYQNYNQFRGVGRGAGRGRYQNDHNRRTQFHQKKNVLINPHFKGNVPIRNNVSLAWDNNHGNNLTNSKKPYMYIEPWVQNQQPAVVNNFLHMQQEPFPILGASYGNASYQQLPPLQMNSKPPVHQRLGINSNLCNIIADNQPFLQMTQHQPFQQIQQNPVPNHVFDQFNNFQHPQYNNNQQVYQNKMPTYESPPAPPPSLNIQTNYPIHNNYCNSYEPLPPPFTQPPNYNQNNIYPQTIPVQNFDTRLVIPTVTFQTNHKQYQMPRKFNQGSPGKRKFDNVKGDLKKKKRSQLFANLHEVQTVDTFPEPVQQKNEVPEDEEMKAYRLKIEQQKLIREKILRQKEERRKQAAKKIQDYQTLVTPKELIKKINPEIATKKTLANANQNIVAIKTVDVKRVINRVVINKNCSNDAAAAAESSESLSKDHLSSFLSNRKIFAKDQSLADTSVVVVNNLASGTSAAKLRKLCQGVGDVQNLQMSSQERQATIQFKSVASAHAFYKKYQRFMLDLSMIQVTLKPLS